VAVFEFNGTIIISNNRFFNNSAIYGGVIRFAPLGLAAKFHLVQNIFDSNTALQGGAIFFSLNNTISLIADNVFVNNTATLYGPTFAGIAHELCFLNTQGSIANNSYSFQKSKVQIFSGDVFPTFGLFFQDVFFQTLVPSGVRVDLLVAYARVLRANGSEPPEAAAIVGYEEAMLQGEDAARFKSLQIVGSAGEYTLFVSPKINYDPLHFNASVKFTLKECAFPNTLQRFHNEPYPRYIECEYLYNCVLWVKISDFASNSNMQQRVQRAIRAMYRCRQMPLSKRIRGFQVSAA
jgi:hypothetical protein